jgi:hypothetical protein
MMTPKEMFTKLSKILNCNKLLAVNKVQIKTLKLISLSTDCSILLKDQLTIKECLHKIASFLNNTIMNN